MVADGRITITIPATPPSLNRWLSSHWRIRDREKADWEAALVAELTRWQLPHCERIEAHVVFRFGDRRKRDLDNHVATLAKCLGDALKHRWIPDDDHLHYAVVSARVEPEPGEPLTTVSLDWFAPSGAVVA